MSEREYNWKRERELVGYACDYAQDIFRRLRQGEYIVYNLSFGNLEYYVNGRGKDICVYVYHKGFCVLYATLDRSQEKRHSAVWQVKYYCHGDWAIEHEKKFRKAAGAAIDDLRRRKWELSEACAELEEADRFRRACFEEDAEVAGERYAEASTRVEDLTDWLNSLPELEASVEFDDDFANVKWNSLPLDTDGLVDPFTDENPVKDTDLERQLRSKEDVDDVS